MERLICGVPNGAPFSVCDYVFIKRCVLKGAQLDAAPLE